MVGINVLAWLLFLLALLLTAIALVVAVVMAVKYLVRRSRVDLQSFAAAVGYSGLFGALILVGMAFFSTREPVAAEMHAMLLPVAAVMVLTGAGQYIAAKWTPRLYGFALVCAIGVIVFGLGVAWSSRP